MRHITNWSIREIAEKAKVSKPAAHKICKHAEKKAKARRAADNTLDNTPDNTPDNNDDCEMQMEVEELSLVEKN